MVWVCNLESEQCCKAENYEMCTAVHYTYIHKNIHCVDTQMRLTSVFDTTQGELQHRENSIVTHSGMELQKGVCSYYIMCGGNIYIYGLLIR